MLSIITTLRPIKLEGANREKWPTTNVNEGGRNTQMPKFVRTFLLALVFIALLAGSTNVYGYIVGDLYEDYIVDFKDLRAFAWQWLHPGCFVPGGVDLWPTEADGLGKSLSRRDPNDYGNDVINWEAATPSPGVVNP